MGISKQMIFDKIVQNQIDDLLSYEKKTGELTAWEADFLESLSEWLGEHDDLTFAQGEKLQEIYGKYELAMSSGF